MDGVGEEFEELMRRVRAGCSEAARTLFDRYSSHIHLIVRRHLDRRLRTQYDSVDIVQSVWASFFRTPPDHCTFDSPDAFVGFMARVAYNKVVETYRQRFRTAKRDARREVPLEEVCPEGGPEPAPARGAALPGRTPQPSPSQVVMAEERWERLLRGQPQKYRRILELLRQGYSQQEAADRLGLNPRLIQRVLRKLQEIADRP
jgi:RNA polymerase sigma-70 factor (ECF subfamily)